MPGILDFLSNLGGPSQAQQAIAAGNWTDPAALSAYRSQDLGNLSYALGRASQQGLGPGTLFGMFGGGFPSAGVPGTQEAIARQSQVGESLARAGLINQQTARMQQMTPYDIAEEQARTGLFGAQAQRIATMTPYEIDQMRAQTAEAAARGRLTGVQADTASYELQKVRAQMRMLGYDPDTMLPLDASGKVTTDQNGDMTGPYRSSLATTESGGNFSQPPNKGGFAGGFSFGAPRLQDLGLYTPGQNEHWDSDTSKNQNQWSGTFNIPGMPEVKTLNDFLGSPQAQIAAQNANELDTEQFIMKNGLDKYIGQTINGVPITYNGMQAVAHLGGNAGLQRYLTSNGQYNPTDGNVRLSDYMQRFSKSGVAPGLQPPLNPNQRVITAGPGAPTNTLPPVSASALSTPPPTAQVAPPTPGYNPAQATIASTPPPSLPPPQAPTGAPGGATLPGSPAPSPTVQSEGISSVMPVHMPPGAIPLSSNPFGLRPGMTPQQAMQQIRQASPQIAAQIAMAKDPLSELTKLMYTPQSYLMVGNGDNGLSPGMQVMFTYNPMTGGMEPKVLQQGVGAAYIPDQGAKLAEQFERVSQMPETMAMSSQVQAAYLAYQRAEGGEKSPAGDFEIIHALAKVLDPRAIVRRATMDIATEDPRTGEMIQRYLNRMKGNNGLLDDRERAEVMQGVDDGFGSRMGVYNNLAQEYRNKGSLIGIPDNKLGIIASPYTGATSYSGFKAAQPPPAALPAPTSAPVAAAPGATAGATASAPVAKAENFSNWTFENLKARARDPGFSQWYGSLPPAQQAAFTAAITAKMRAEQDEITRRQQQRQTQGQG